MTHPAQHFQDAVEARDLDAMRATLAPDVRFYPPIRYRPFEGADTVTTVLSIPARLFAFADGFRYTRALDDDDGWVALFFDAVLPSGHNFEGVDYLHVDTEGLVDELGVMMRPLAQLKEFDALAIEVIAELFP